MKRILLLFTILAVSVSVAAQNYTVQYNDTPVEQVLKDLKARTGYEFVCQTSTLEDISPLTVSYRGLTLNQLLDRILTGACGLEYEIVRKTIILRKPVLKDEDDDGPWFKSLVTGIVIDESEEPLAGAAIMLKDTRLATMTDVDGQFSMIVEGKNPVLEISFLGMKTAEVVIDPKRDVQFYPIRMESESLMMKAVLVTGYQNVKKETSTGSYQLVTAEKLENKYDKDLLRNLEGKIPGLVSYNNGVSGDGEAGLTIRGAASFQARTNPLVVVDGLPIEGGLNSVNQYNIESITVLKDAAAASIYGARASNGVIVITTKKAKSDRLDVEFSADLNISERNDYSVMRWADASQMVQLERYNFEYVRDKASSAFGNLKNYYNDNRGTLSPVSRLLMANYLGEMSDAELNSRLTALSGNDYRKEWQKVVERPQVTHQYNLAIRNRGKYLNSNLVINYLGDNEGRRNEYGNDLTMSWKASADITKWLNLEFGANMIMRRSKTHLSSEWNGINSFAPYMSMYNEDGSLADMEAGAYLGEASLSNASLGLKSESYNILNELGRNFEQFRENNLRSYVHATVTPLEGWTISAMFQYEDIYSKSEGYQEADSYDMRHLYNLYTATDGTHYLPDAGILRISSAEGSYYTFRAQTDYTRTIADKHEFTVLGGFEYRQTRYRSKGYTLLGYDDDSQTSNMGTANFGELHNLDGGISALGKHYSMFGAPTGSDFPSSDVLHRYYSLYLNGNYSYDHRYTASASVRVDNTDLFGADPKFRRRPLWSVGASWNINNEEFMKNVEWVDALKLRASYGLTGNIDQNVSSYLTASIGVNDVTGRRYAAMNTPPNDQLRWEKTASLNLGLDFALLDGRLSGALDGYLNRSSDLLTVTDIDPSTGWTSLTINNGKAINAGVELQLDGIIIEASTREQFGLSASSALSYNYNAVTAVNHEPASGLEALSTSSLKKGYPIHSLWSYKFAGVKNFKGIQTFGWIDHEGNSNFTSIESEEFTPEDVVYSGSLDPKVVFSLSPELTWQGFSLSALICVYGGHVMRARTDEWSYEGSQYGYTGLAEIEAVPASYLNFWTKRSTMTPANGYQGSVNVVGDYHYLDASVVPADYLKLRNIVLSYSFSDRICRKLKIGTLSLRAQVNNVCTWHRNKLGLDPEACSPSDGTVILATPRSYTMSMNLTF